MNNNNRERNFWGDVEGRGEERGQWDILYGKHSCHTINKMKKYQGIEMFHMSVYWIEPKSEQEREREKGGKRESKKRVNFFSSFEENVKEQNFTSWK